MKRIFENAHQRTYPKGQIILYQGTVATEIFYINKGYIKVYDINTDGEEKILLILGPGDILPIVWSYKGDFLHYFYASLTEVDLLAEPFDQFVKESESHHDRTLKLLHYFVDRSQELMKRIESIDSTSAEKKILLTLDYIASVHGASKGAQIVLPEFITHELVARMSGLSRETTSTVIKELENCKVLSQRPDFTVNKKKLTGELEK